MFNILRPKKELLGSTQSEVVQLRLQRFIPAGPARILRMLSKIEDFPRFLPNVKKVEILEKGERSAVTHWFIEIEGLPIQWKERDQFDYSNFTVTFSLIEGDLEQFEGKWTLEKLGDGTEVTVEVSARLGIPVLEKVVSDILQEKLTKNFQLIFEGLENRFIAERYSGSGGATNIEKPAGFAVMGHPYNFNHLVRIFKFFKPDLRCVTQEFLLKLFELTPSYHSYDLPNFKSSTGATVNGYYVMCPIIPDMIDVSPDRVFEKVVEGCHIGERLGAGILALGGFTSIVSERYQEKLRQRVRIPLTTGNAFTAAMALEGVKKAAALMDIDLKKAQVTVIGGTGDIGSAVARVLAREVQHIIITGRTKENMNLTKKRLQKEGGARIDSTSDNNEAIKKADIVIAAASSAQSLVNIGNFKPGSVICDVAYPKNISHLFAQRNDLFAFSGGLCELPSPFAIGFDTGLPTKMILYGCFSEAMILSLEGRYEDYSRGKGLITPQQIETIRMIGAKHGFKLAPFYSGERQISDEEVRSIRSNVSTR